MHINGIQTGYSCNAMMASANPARHAHWSEMLSETASFSCASTLDELRDQLQQLKPDILFLDRNLTGLNNPGTISRLRKQYPGTHIVMLEESTSDENELAMFCAGVRGICSADIDGSTLKLMIRSVMNGELWIRRSLTFRLMEQLRESELLQTEADETASQLDNLTHREYEVAVRVGNGDSNKSIARSLAISESTVKAHLTSIFRKTGVTDRFKVAMMLSSRP